MLQRCVLHEYRLFWQNDCLTVLRLNACIGRILATLCAFDRLSFFRKGKFRKSTQEKYSG